MFFLKFGFSFAEDGFLIGNFPPPDFVLVFIFDINIILFYFSPYYIIKLKL